MGWNSWPRSKAKPSKIALCPKLTFFFIVSCILSPYLTNCQRISRREQTLLGIIEKQGVGLDCKKFYYDPVMVQASTKSVYTNPKKKPGQNFIFAKSNPDAGKDALVLSSADNQFAIPTPRGNLKRQFILMKKSPNAAPDKDNTPYYASFVYVRNMLQNDSTNNIFEVAGVKSIVEWDVWETRPKGFFAGWETCDHTMFLTCESLRTIVIKADKATNGDTSRRRRSLPSYRQRRSLKPKALSPIKGDDGTEPGEYNDLYLDLDIHEIASLNPANDQGKVRRKRYGWPVPQQKASEQSQKMESKKEKSSKKGSKTNVKVSAGTQKNDEDTEGKSDTGILSSILPGGKQGNNPLGGLGKLNPLDAVSKATKPLTNMNPLSGGNPLDSLGSGLDGIVGSNPLDGLGGLDGLVGANPLEGLGSGLNGLAGANPLGGLNGLNGLGAQLPGLGQNPLGGLMGGQNPLGGLMGGLGQNPLGGLMGGQNPLGGLMGGLGQNPLGGLMGGLGQNPLGGLLGGQNPLGGLMGGQNPLGGLMGGQNPLGGLMGGQNPLGGLMVGQNPLGGLMGGQNPLGGLLGGLTQLPGLNNLPGLAGDANPLKALGDSNYLNMLSQANPTSMLGNANPLNTFTSLMSNMSGGIPLLGQGGSPLASLSGLNPADMFGESGPMGFATGFLTNALGSPGVLTSMLDPSAVTGGLGNVFQTLSLGDGSGGIADAIGGVFGGIAGSGGPLSMAQKLLGPAFSTLNPVTSVVAMANGILQNLPEVAYQMAYGALSPIVESLVPTGFLHSLGLGPLFEMGGMFDSILSIPESVLTSVDVISNGLRDGATQALVQMGVPPEVATLATLGAQTALNVELIKWKGVGMGIRLGAELFRGSMNGGKHRGAGSQSVGSNKNTMFGFVYPGAGNGKSFFFPHGSLIRATFRTEKGIISGYFELGVPGKEEMFHPDGESKDAERFWGIRGVIVPNTYKQPHRDATNGIAGMLDQYNVFVSDATPRQGVLRADNLEDKSSYWMAPETDQNIVHRPETMPDGKNLIYGYFFNGIRQSPHVFVAEGDTLTGFFIPDDADHPEHQEPTHGIFAPSHPAGHALFILDNPQEYENVKEVRGAFFPDAMNLYGALSGLLSKTKDGTMYSLILDRPGVEFIYIKDDPSVKNVWASFLNNEEWNYTPPPIPPPAPKEDKPKTEEKKGLLGGVVADVGLTKKREEYGTKITTQKTEAFFPKSYPIDGYFVPVDKKVKYLPMAGQMLADKYNTVWNVTIVQRNPDGPKITAPVGCLFIAVGYPKDDAVIGALVLNAEQTFGNFKVMDQQKTAEHFWTADDTLWIPQGFGDKVKAEAEEEAKKKSQSVPGVEKESTAPPEKPPNYHLGRNYESSPEMDEMLLKDLPREFTYGFYFNDAQSPGPLFVPDVGAVGIFVPGEGNPEKAFFFPQRHDLPAVMVLANPGSIPDGTKGSFVASTMKDEPTTQFFRGTLGTPFEVGAEVEVIPGWKYATTKKVAEGDVPAGSVEKEYFKSQRCRLNYALVDVGGGFKGVAVEGSEALDDANNPVFQQFLHYRAQQSGDVNPWGDVIVIDPLDRDETEERTSAGIYISSYEPGTGYISRAVEKAPKMSKDVLNSFSLTNWRWPQAAEIGMGQKIPGMKIGTHGNVASMMDFRMFVSAKYHCKRSRIDGKWIQLLTPIGAESFLTVKKPRRPLKAWLELITKTDSTIAFPSTQGIVGCFSAQHSIHQNDIAPFTRVAGSGMPSLEKSQSRKKRDMFTSWAAPFSSSFSDFANIAANQGKNAPEWTKMSAYKTWGDEASCDEIELNDMTAAQALSGGDDKDKATGVDMGLQLVGKVGCPMEYPEIAGKLLEKVEKKQKEPPKSVLDNVGTPDLLGTRSQAVKENMAQKKAVEKERKGKANVEAKVDRRKRNAEDDDPGRNMPGWKTQHRTLTENATLSSAGIIFYGIGNCKMEGKPPLSLLESTKESDMVDYYLKVLRIDCMPNAKERVLDLINHQIITIGEGGKFFEVPPTNKILTEPRLTPEEIRLLSKGFELSAFSKTYHLLRTKGYSTSGILIEPNCQITRSVGFLTELSLYYISKARKVSPAHSVRLNRNFLTTLRTVLTKLHQDTLILNHKCPDGCTFDKKITAGDKFRIVSLIEFIIHGLIPYERGDKQLKPSFYSFVKLNINEIKERLAEFERQFPQMTFE